MLNIIVTFIKINTHNSNKQKKKERDRDTQKLTLVDVIYVYYFDFGDGISKVCIHPNNKSMHINYMKLFVCQI